jgi:hypothetical protein
MKHIIHFTSSFEKLKKIIETSHLKLHYCKEEFYLGDKKISSAAHPMVSFSEYDINTIDKKNITYGRFGIAFKKSWIEKNKLHPLLYIDRDSIIAKSLASLLIARRNSTRNLSDNVRLSIMMLKCFTKNSIGYNSYFRISNFNFKDENEWRFVPTKKQIEGKLISIDRSKYLKKRNFYNDELKAFSLTFDINDIEYLFTETWNQVSQIQNMTSIDKSKIRISKWSP